MDRRELYARTAYKVLDAGDDDPWDRACARRAAIMPSDPYTKNQLKAFAVADAIIALDGGLVLVPREPTDEMADQGAHCNSEWLNDQAPLGEGRYRMPALAVWRTMLRVALGEDPRHGFPEGFGQ